MPATSGQQEEIPLEMPTATVKSTRSTRYNAKPASRAGASRARKPSKANRAKAARAHAASQTRLTATERSTVLGDYAERAVLIPVGVALTARDRVISSVNGAISSYSSPSRAQAQLRRFERRGATARNRLEREVRKARVRVERQLRQRRRVIKRTVGEFEDRRDVVAKNGSELANELATRIQESVLNRV
jgi:hypothetical protein